MTTDDAMNHIVASLQKTPSRYALNSYDIYTQNVIEDFVINVEKIPRDGRGYTFRDRCIEVSPLFLSALWELSRRGVVRPGLSKIDEGGVGHNVFGAGFSFTPHGRVWLQNADYEAVATVIPARFVELLSKHQKRFGAGYLSRGAEAVRCYSAHAFLAACAMCGAAAESILLAIASERKPAKDVLAMYSRLGGRAQVEKLVIGQQNTHVQDTFRGFMMLLKYWRDEAAHGRASEIGETEAFTALMLLLRLARFANETFEPARGRLV